MSGGVDSSVAAFLLKHAGYEVVGFFMKLWHDPKCDISRENACCDDQAQADARAIAKQLEIPFYVVDARDRFKQDVTDYFIDEYRNCRTPNPCIVCNEKIKFGWLLEYAEKMGCDFLATGHYARIVNPGKLSSIYDQCSLNDQLNKLSTKDLNDHSNHLLKGLDESRDQSYFLYRLNQEQLSKIIFPIGDMKKSEVRKLAEECDLPVFEKAESREICFVADDYRNFLQRYLPEDSFKSGEIVDTKGHILGHHEGLVNYTIGQRRSVNQELRIMNKGEDTKPLYVVRLDKEKNQLVVGEDAELWHSKFLVDEMTFISPETELRIMKNELRGKAVKIRYGADLVDCSVCPDHNSLFIIRTSSPLRAITPGQSAVIYLDDEVVGGGIISSL